MFKENERTHKATCNDCSAPLTAGWKHSRIPYLPYPPRWLVSDWRGPESDELTQHRWAIWFMHWKSRTNQSSMAFPHPPTSSFHIFSCLLLLQNSWDLWEVPLKKTSLLTIAELQHWVVAKVEAWWRRALKNVTFNGVRGTRLSPAFTFFAKRLRGHTEISDLCETTYRGLGHCGKWPTRGRKISKNILCLKPSTGNSLQSVHTDSIVFTQAIVVEGVVNFCCHTK